MRIKDEDTIETSKGIRIGIKEGKRLYQLVKKVMDRGVGWERNGQKIKVRDTSETRWHIDSISKNGDLEAGCHSINHKEIKEVAAKMGW